MSAAAANVAPLEGVFVLEVANWIAAPCCGALLADLGADVIKIEVRPSRLMSAIRPSRLMSAISLHSRMVQSALR
eukprot:SAG11_NODE_706_length_7651_cov_4.192399_8_plen_75_part_00